MEVGQAYKQQWIIKKGLKEGERVIYDGLQKVRPGMIVNIKDKESTPKKAKDPSVQTGDEKPKGRVLQ